MLGIYLSMLNSAADQEAFQALYERNKYKVFHAAQGIVKNKLWAEDVVHEAFLYVADHYEELSGKYTEGLDGYLYRCVQCRAVNLLRRRGREESYEAWMETSGRDGAAAPEGDVGGCRPAAAAENLWRGAGVGLRGMEYGGDRGASGTFPAHGAAAAGTGVGDDTGGVERE